MTHVSKDNINMADDEESVSVDVSEALPDGEEEEEELADADKEQEPTENVQPNTEEETVVEATTEAVENEQELKPESPAVVAVEAVEEGNEETKITEEKAEDEAGGESAEQDHQIKNVDHIEDVDAVPLVDVTPVVADGAAVGDGAATPVADSAPVSDGVVTLDADSTAVGDVVESVQADEEGDQGGKERPPEEGEEQAKVEEEQEPAAEETEEVPVPAEERPEEEIEQPAEEKEERIESPVLVVEPVLSREPTPVSVDQQYIDRLEVSSPAQSVLLDVSEADLKESTEEVSEPVETEPLDNPAVKREALLEKYYEAQAEKDILMQTNTSLQQKLAEYFRKKKADEKPDYEKSMTDQDQRYLKYMAQLEDLRHQYQMEKHNYNHLIEDLKDKCQERKEKVDMERRKFIEYKQDVAMHALFGRSGKPIPPRDIEQYIGNEAKKEQEVVNVRLENIKLKNKLKKKEQQLKSKEELADGLHLIDFEQLKIENQTYNEKIEERNEELLKLRKKITSTVQVLTHLKEKLQFVQGANGEQNSELQEVEASLAKSRDILSRTKQARDALRNDNERLRQNSGLLGNEPLLRDFEAQKDEATVLLSQIEKLKMRHAEMTLNCNQVRQKIDQVKTAQE